MVVLAATAAGRKPRQRLLLALLTAAGAVLLLAMARALPAQLQAVQPRRCQTKALLPLKHRELFGQLLEEEGFTVGAELGVQVSGGLGRAARSCCRGARPPTSGLFVRPPCCSGAGSPT